MILSSEKNIRSMFDDAGELGATLDPHQAFLILRGMKTYMLRYERQAANARTIAEFLRSHESVDRVFFPDDQPNEAHDYGAVISFDLKDKNRSIDPIIDGTRLFHISASLGSTESLIAPVKYFYGNDLSTEELKIAQIDETTVRLSIGIEDAQDLITDLRQALD